jgi:hypothetical protein
MVKSRQSGDNYLFVLGIRPQILKFEAIEPGISKEGPALGP